MLHCNGHHLDNIWKMEERRTQGMFLAFTLFFFFFFELSHVSELFLNDCCINELIATAYQGFPERYFLPKALVPSSAYYLNTTD